MTAEHKTLLAKGQEVEPLPYYVNGKSLYYNKESVRCLPFYSSSGYRLSKTRVLRLGNPSDLGLVSVASDLYPNVPSPCYALREYLRTTVGDTPVYIFDDHNHALFAWYEAREEGRIENGATLLHFDDHLDGMKPKRLPNSGWSLEEVANYAQSLNNNEFIYPAMFTGLINSTFWINWGSRDKNNGRSYENFEVAQDIFYKKAGGDSLRSVLQEANRQKLIIDVDIDYFRDWSEDPAREEKDEEKYLQIIKTAMAQTGVATIAISPEYISPIKALELVKKLLQD